MPRLYLPVTQIIEGHISITGDKARYLISVLRCREGDELIVFDGKNNCFRTKIVHVTRKEVTVRVLEKFPCDSESPLHITLVQGLLKGEKMDMVIQKATELGVKEIIPVITERSQVRETRKVSRWIKIAEEASKQSGRSMIPIIHEPMNFSDIFSIHSSRFIPRGFIFYEEGGMKLSEAVSSLVTRHSSLFVIIGPEGGFTKEEVAFAKEKGLIVTSLGKRILRAETAAISAITLVQFLLGDTG
jgi:16S rRNA (uracil1498-N3)-methyltransferase